MNLAIELTLKLQSGRVWCSPMYPWTRTLVNTTLVALPSSRNFHSSAQLRIERKCLCQFKHLLPNTSERLSVLIVPEGFNDPGSRLDHFLLFHSARGKCGRTNPDSAGLERGIAVKRNSVFIHGNACLA